MTSVAIIGAGIIGMTNAICLLEQGFDVTIFTQDDPFKTNSDAAVATWYVPENDKPLLQRLCLESLSKWRKLSQVSESGVQPIPIVYYFKDEEDFNSSIWSNAALREQLQMTLDIPEGYAKSGEFQMRVLAQVPLIDPIIYRAYLFTQFQNLKGKLKKAKVETLAPLADHYDLVLNCAGWEAKYLTQDHRIYPARGQVEIIQLNKAPENPRSMNVRDKDGYVVFRPKSNTYAVGTTYQINDTSLTPREQDKKTTWDKMIPFTSHAILEESENTWSQVGIRCGRFDVRLEDEILESPAGKKALLVHCYGHGGSGFSASWASAACVLEHCLDYCAGEKKAHRPVYSRL